MAQSTLEKLSLTHKALADETRLRILHVLADLGELCVCDIEAGLDITQSKASRHLGVLKQAGLIKARRDGTWIHYGIHDDLSESTTAIVAGIGATFGATREAKRDVRTTERLRRSC